MFRIIQASPSDDDIRELIKQLDEYQQTLYPDESNHLDTIEELTRSDVYFVAAYDKNPDSEETTECDPGRSDAIGCGAIKYCRDDESTELYGEIKRLYVEGAARGKGISRQLMSALELHALERGVGIVRLETGIYQPEAIGLYEKMGYQKTEAFGGYSNDDPFSVFMKKELFQN
ncbi:MAG: GNAT family N-acetyltransferase [Gammaproteobacteria bacterium]|nr:GNAT family N-acetyltransferase [Gammaproteobacteria bacterium]